VRILRRSLPLVAATILLGVATVLVLLAVDVRGWQQTLGRGDAEFLARPSSRMFWQSPAVLPGDPVRSLLGLDDALAYRQSLQGFWLNEVGVVKSRGNDLSAARVGTQTELERLAASARTAAERSSAANLLGVMTITTTSTDTATLMQILANSEGDFQEAIALDSTNWAAKVNLELVLRLQHPGKSKFGADARGGFGFGGSEGAGVAGGGF
jgi:hypothetical protein